MQKEDCQILIVDDEPDIIEFLGYNLRREGYTVYTANDGVEAVEIALKVKPHLVLLDVMMPKMDGFEACKRIRENETLNNTIIAFLTARGEDYNQIAGFELGADDYINKPIKPKVLISRINALIKRSTLKLSSDSNKPEFTEIGNLKLNREKFLVYKDEEELILTKKEFELLEILSSNLGKVFTREEIFTKVWGEDIIVGDRTIDVHIRRLREKIGDDFIKTVKGVGYKLIVN
jgi:two-component system alkaline phosphatase synthesis response regulator PhoP